MVRFLVLCFALIPAALQAQVEYLPPDAHFFFQWEGTKAFPEKRAKTGWGKTLNSETGTFFKAVWDYGKDTVEALQGNGTLPPEAAGAIRDGMESLGVVYEHGFCVAGRMDNFNPPQGVIVAVFPKGAAGSAPILTLAKKLCALDGQNPAETKTGGRTIYSIEDNEGHLGWWRDGDTVIFVLGNERPDIYARKMDQKLFGLAKHPLYQQVMKKDDFPSDLRGFIDVAGFVKMVGEKVPEAQGPLKDTGLEGLKSLTLRSGPAGEAHRTIIEWDMPKPRRGLLAMFSEKKLDLKDLPPLPQRVSAFSATTFNLGVAYESFLDGFDGVAKAVTGGELSMRQLVKMGEAFIGVDLSKDVFACFGDMYVGYRSLDDDGGLPLFSGVQLFKVKDEAKLKKSLDTMLKAIPQNEAIEVKRRTFEGVEIIEMRMQGPKNVGPAELLLLGGGQLTSGLPSFAIDRGWLIIGTHVQHVQGQILRSQGKLPVWQPDARFKTALKTLPKDFTSVDMIDLASGLERVLRLLPTGVNLGNNFTGLVGMKEFDSGLIPHPRWATRHLFPVVGVTSQHGDVIRTEYRTP